MTDSTPNLPPASKLREILRLLAFDTSQIPLKGMTADRQQTALAATAATVLLESGWERVEVTDSSATERAWREFRARVLMQHRVQRPVWETQVNGRPIALLDQPVRSRGHAEVVSLGDLVEDPRALAELAAVERGCDEDIPEPGDA